MDMNSLFHNALLFPSKRKTFHTPARLTDNTRKGSLTDWIRFDGLMDRVIELTHFLLFVETPFSLLNTELHLILLFDGKEQKQKQ